MAGDLFNKDVAPTVVEARREAFKAVRILARVVETLLHEGPSPERVAVRDLIALMTLSLGETLNVSETENAWEQEPDAEL